MIQLCSLLSVFVFPRARRHPGFRTGPSSARLSRRLPVAPQAHRPWPLGRCLLFTAMTTGTLAVVARAACVAPPSFYDAPVAETPTVTLGPIQILQAYDAEDQPVPLAVADHSGDEALDVWVRWAGRESARPALIQWDATACLEGLPRSVAVTVFVKGACELAAVDVTGAPVAIAVAEPGRGLQTLVLRSSNGIRRVILTGEQFAIMQVCWQCERTGDDTDLADRYRDLQPRPVLPTPRIETIPEHFARHVLVVKFQEGTRMQLKDRTVEAVVLPHDADAMWRLARSDLTPDQARSGAATFNAWLADPSRVAAVEPHFNRPRAALEASRIRGENRSGRELADLNLYLTVFLSETLREGEVLQALTYLNSLPVVEAAFPLPLPQDASLPRALQSGTPDFTADQHYRHAAPQGVDADYAWQHPGGRGAGVRIVDIEGGWNLDHEDLPALFYQDGVNWGGNHGTAVLGILAAVDNGFGMTGIVPESDIGVGSVGNSHGPYALAAAIDRTAAALDPGDIIVIEQHLHGPNTRGPCDCNESQCEFIPVEYWQNYYDTIATATANGVVVVEAAGNGSVDLDDPGYNDRFNRNVRDSGAILVGAADVDTFAIKEPACWTNYGSRVDLSGWGDELLTLGYGALHTGSGRDEWYTDDFGGTSGASPVVAGVAAAVQGYLRAHGRAPLDPLSMRALLSQTGTGQVPGTRHIGPLPSIRHAIHELLRVSLASGDFNGDGQADLALGNPTATVDGAQGAGIVRVFLSDNGPLSLGTYTEFSQGGTDVDLFGIPEENDFFGFALASGDFNGDAFDDLAIGAPYEDWSEVNAGLVLVIYGSASGLHASPYNVLHEDQGIDLDGSVEVNDLLGFALAAADFDGDGYDDLAIGSPGESYDTKVNSGALHVVYGSSKGFVSTADQDVRHSSPGFDNFLGRALVGWDLDADGRAELVVGHPGWDENGHPDVGRVIWYEGASGGIPGSATAIGGSVVLAQSDDATVFGDLAHARMGEALGAGYAAGQSGEGLLFIGLPGYRDAGLFASGAVLEVVDIDDPTNGLLLELSEADSVRDLEGNSSAFALAGGGLAAGDFDGDGIGDLAVGVPGVGADDDEGRVHVAFGSLFYVSGLADVRFEEDDWLMETAGFGEFFGSSLAALDRNGDGYTDLVIAAPGEDGDSASNHLFTLYGSGSGMKTFSTQPAPLDIDLSGGDVIIRWPGEWQLQTSPSLSNRDWEDYVGPVGEIKVTPLDGQRYYRLIRR